jgi:vacuolar protein sorting-associated protein IST1
MSSNSVCSYRYSDDEYDDRGTMQFKDAASAARAAAESAERAASAAKAAADFANKNNHPFDEDEDCKASSNEFTHPRKRQSMSNSSRSSRKEDADAFDEVKPHGGRASSTGSFSGKNHVEDDNDRYPVDLDSRKTRRRNGRAARKVHSEIKFDDSEGLCSESEDENDVEIQSVERPLPPTREPFSENRHSEDEEPDQDFPELPKANLHSRVHPNMPLDYETLTARFEALKSGKLP